MDESDVSKELSELLPKEGDAPHADKLIHIVACANALDKHMREGSFGLQFPSVIIETSTVDTQKRERLEDGIPSGLVFLAEGSLTSKEMWTEMVTKGLPNRNTLDLEHKIASSAWGIEYEIATEENYDPGAQLRSRNRLVFLEMSPVSKTDDEPTPTHFDTLSYILAVRVSRKIKEFCDAIDNGTISSDQPEKDKSLAISRSINGFLNFLMQAQAKDVNTKRNFSILLVAMLESEQNDGGWTSKENIKKHKEEQAEGGRVVDFVTARDELLILRGLGHLSKSVRNILVHDNNEIKVRSEEEIRDLGKEYVWNVLSNADKTQLSLKLLSSDPCEEGHVWSELKQPENNALLREVRAAMNFGRTMSEGSMVNLVSLVFPREYEHMSARCITIRRKQNPFDENDVQILVEPDNPEI